MILSGLRAKILFNQSKIMKTFEKLFMREEWVSLYVWFQKHFQENKIQDTTFTYLTLKYAFRVSSTMARGYETNMSQVKDFLQKSKGYVGDLKTLIYVGQQLGYFDEENVKDLLAKCSKIWAGLYKFIVSQRPKEE